ncbi:MAG: TetR/AcrR family transcriptional regulator, partial [Mycobacteriales bacterium]
MGRKPTPDARDNLLDAAERLFNAHGVHAVGLQQIIDACGCGKNMLYREFRSKDDLVVGYLRRSHQDWMCMVDAVIAPLVGDPGAQIIAIVKAAAAKATAPDARGCPLRNTHAEFPEADHPAHQVAVEHFHAVRAQLLGLARQAGAADPEILTDRLLLIIDGLYA